jgi:asparaginyl-tRNA synthetase
MNLINYIGKTIKLKGWIVSIRQQGKKLIFIDLRIPNHIPSNIQCVFFNKSLPSLYPESVIEVTGVLNEDKRSVSGFELQVSEFELLSLSTNEQILNDDSSPHHRLINRHIDMRNPNLIKMLILRAKFLKCFEEWFSNNNVTKITPPSFVNTPCEGGATLFNVKYGEITAYLTQSSQFYLEACVPAIGDCYCIHPSFRAEKSHTRRHLTEFTHLEAEFAFCDLTNLIDKIEDMVDYVIPEKYSRPYTRLTYHQYIDKLYELNITNDGIPYTYDDDVPERDERKFIDTMNEPVFLTHFPSKQKSFYMAKDPENPNLTLSTDLLFPRCGEIVGASVRMTDYNELVEACKKEGISPENFSLYLDLRKYGSSYSAGFGLGVERLLMCILNLENVKMAIPFPRTMDLIEP